MPADPEELAAAIQADIDALRPTALFAGSAAAAAALELGDAYAIQQAAMRLRTARGERTTGFKVGCTSASIQTQFGLNQPVRAYLWEGERREDGAALPAAAFRNLAIEGELGVWVVDSSAASVLDWEVEWGPVVELHHYVWDGDPPSSVELVARNAIQAVRPPLLSSHTPANTPASFRPSAPWARAWWSPLARGHGAGCATSPPTASAPSESTARCWGRSRSPP